MTSRVTFVAFLSAAAVTVALLFVGTTSLPARPYDDDRFKGRIACSADGNHNDPDDWSASPVALAIIAEAGLRDRLVHFDYNSILPLTNPEWEGNHAASVLGAVALYGYDRTRFFDDRQNLDGAIASIVRAIDASAADDPLYFIIAGPMEVPYRALQACDPAKRRFVYCISHSRWNDGFASQYKFSFTKRSVIEQDVHWVQIQDQNRKLSFGRFGSPAKPEEFAPYFWMRDSRDPKIRFLWDRMVVSTRPDPSDAGMSWFLVSGDEECTPDKLRALLEERKPLPRTAVRASLRLEAENFRHLENLIVDDRNDRNASHRLSVRAKGAAPARLRTRFDEPYARPIGRYDIEVRHSDDQSGTGTYALRINGVLRGAPWTSAGRTAGWVSHVVRGVDLKFGDELQLDLQGSSARVDFVQLHAPGNRP